MFTSRAMGVADERADGGRTSGDYSYALIWALRMPPLSTGGMLQAVPHTHWDKKDRRGRENPEAKAAQAVES